jgi:hypothetical protein
MLQTSGSIHEPRGKRTARPLWSIRSVWFIPLNENNQMNQISQINDSYRSCAVDNGRLLEMDTS